MDRSRHPKKFVTVWKYGIFGQYFCTSALLIWEQIFPDDLSTDQVLAESQQTCSQNINEPESLENGNSIIENGQADVFLTTRPGLWNGTNNERRIMQNVCC